MREMTELIGVALGTTIIVWAITSIVCLNIADNKWEREAVAHGYGDFTENGTGFKWKEDKQ